MLIICPLDPNRKHGKFGHQDLIMRHYNKTSRLYHLFCQICLFDAAMLLLLNTQPYPHVSISYLQTKVNTTIFDYKSHVYPCWYNAKYWLMLKIPYQLKTIQDPVQETWYTGPRWSTRRNSRSTTMRVWQRTCSITALPTLHSTISPVTTVNLSWYSFFRIWNYNA